jgi:hypothetical protein
VKVGDLIRVNDKLNDLHFPDNKTGIITKVGITGEIYEVCFVNGFITKIFIKHMELISSE